MNTSLELIGLADAMQKRAFSYSWLHDNFNSGALRYQQFNYNPWREERNPAISTIQPRKYPSVEEIVHNYGNWGRNFQLGPWHTFTGFDPRKLYM